MPERNLKDLVEVPAAVLGSLEVNKYMKEEANFFFIEMKVD